MADFSVRSTELRNKAAQLSELNQKFLQEKNNLVNAKSILMKGFEGDAATAFATAFDTFASQMDNFKTIVDKYVTCLNEDADAYDKADSAARQAAESRI